MIIIPLAVGALAVAITLCYASYLDILDRRVPFVTWYPMLVIGLPAAGIAFLFLNDGISLFTGYLEIISVILFVAYLGNRDSETPVRFVFIVPVLAVQLYSGWYFSMVNGTGVIVLSAISLLIVTYASYLETRKPDTIFSVVWPLLYFMIGALCWFSYALSGGGTAFLFLGMIEIFCLIFYLFGILQLFGGADAWALIFVTLILPLFPFEPFTGYPALAFFPFTVLVNAVVFNLVAPAGLFFMNLLKGNRAPWPYLFLGYPVDGNKIAGSFGFVMEEFKEQDGIITRRFLKLRETLASAVRGQRRVYTRDLRVNPEKYSGELGLYKKAGKVWISYGVPFMVPITAGLLFGLFVGDIITICLKFIGGA